MIFSFDSRPFRRYWSYTSLLKIVCFEVKGNLYPALRTT